MSQFQEKCVTDVRTYVRTDPNSQDPSAKRGSNISIDLKYADDITFVRSEKAKINTVKRVIPKQLEEADLIENSDKREEIIVSRESNPEWKKCKYLGYFQKQKHRLLQDLRKNI